MKKILSIATILVSSICFSQSVEPQLEVSGNLVKATYLYENGAVQQVGFFKEGKLEGTWTSYDKNGFVQAEATYSEGKKVGTWTYYNNSVSSKKVAYSDNSIIAVEDLKNAEVVSKN